MKKLLTAFLLLAANTFCLKAQWVSIPDTNFGTWLNSNGVAFCLQGNNSVGWQMDTTCSSVINFSSIECDSSNISDLTGIQYFHNLYAIDCFNNNLTFLPPLPMPHLWQLKCQHNKITSISQLPNSLLWVYCDDNLLTTLPELPDSMNYLSVSNNPLTCLPELKRIWTLEFTNTQVGCLYNYGSITNGTPYIYNLPLCQIGNANGCAVDTTCNSAHIDSIITTPAACLLSNGSATINLGGGASVFSYSLDGGWHVFSNVINSLPAGSHFVQTFDFHGCADTATFYISQNTTLRIDSVSTAPSCDMTATGSACAHVSAGSPPYTYNWIGTSSTASCADSLWGYWNSVAYFVTVTDAVGCSVTASFSISTVPPLNVQIISISDGQLPDTLSADVTAGTSPYHYSWGWWGTNINDTSSTLVVDTSGYYGLTVTDSTGCRAGWDSIAAGCGVNGCVWPGDADHNGIADNNDLLAIGLGYGTVGTPRSWVTNTWFGYLSQDWPDTLTSGTNYKHIDCNGNGIINADDTTAIIQNYSLTHAKAEDHIAGWRMTDPALNVVLTPDTTRAGDTLYAFLSLGDINIPANNVYGLAFTINYDALVVDSSKTKVTFGNSWLGNATDKISIAKDFYQDGQLKCALTRIDHTTRSGFGQIGQVEFVITTDNINGKNLAYHQVNVWISDLRVIDNLGNYISVNEGYDSSQVEFEPTDVGIDQHSQLKIGIVPNPATDMVRISVSEQLVGANLKVLDINGQLMAHVVLGATNTQLSIHDYPAGIYLLQFLNEGVVITKRLVVTR